MSHRALVCALVLAAGAAGLRADVSPYPTWAFSTNGTVASVAQLGDVVYAAGTFTKVGRAIAGQEAWLDASLAPVPRSGCAQVSTGFPTFVGGRLFFARQQGLGPPVPPLRDALGPFDVDPSVELLRVGDDCRFDRRFRLDLPDGVTPSGAVEFEGRVFVSAFYVFSGAPAVRGIVEADGVTGELVRYWITPEPVTLIGVAAGRIVAYEDAAATDTVGTFEPWQGRFLPERSLPAGVWTFTVLGDRVLASGPELLMLDAMTLAPLPQWPDVRGSASRAVVAGGRLFLAHEGITVNGLGVARVVAFDAVTGALAAGWTPPAWVSDPSTRVDGLAGLGSRLLVQGDFATGAPRDTLAVLDAASGALDPYVFPYVATRAQVFGGVVHLGVVRSEPRVPRDRVAAFEVSTGAPLPWQPGPLPAPAVVGRFALAAHGDYVYLSSGTSVRRFSTATGARDEAWVLEVPPADVPIVLMMPGADALYVVGGFAQARAGGNGAFVERAGGAAVSYNGALTAWSPQVQGTCAAGGIHRYYYPCIRSSALAQGRVFLSGEVQLLTEVGVRRSLAVLSADSGALDPATPMTNGVVFAPGPWVGALAADGDVVYAGVSVAPSGPSLLVRFDPGLRAVVVGPDAHAVAAARAGLVYADVERDGLTGRPTGNATTFAGAVATEGGIVNQWSSLGDALTGFHPAIAARPPGTPTALTASASGSRVAFRWTRSAADLQPYPAPSAAGGSAATSHVLLASLVPGGSVVAQVETGAADTEHSVTAPSGTFFVRVQSKNRFGTSAPSDEVRVDVIPSVPDAPMATVASVSSQGVRLTWQAAPGGWPATAYVLEAGRTSDAGDIGAVTVAGTAFVVPRVPTGRYYVRVRAVNAQGTSAPGNEVVVDVP